jgi:8-oxo-dGTP diphosphatase
MSYTTDHPRVRLAVLIRKDEAILMGQYVYSFASGLWTVPGGGLDYGESLEICAKREVAEEAGIEITGIKKLGFTEYINLEEEKHSISLYVGADWVSGEPKEMEPEKIGNWHWVTRGNLPSPLFPALEKFIASGFDPWAS